MEDEFLGREANARFDEGRIETHAPRGRIDVGAGVSEDRARLIVQEVDADLLQDRKRGLMDRIELVLRDEVQRRERRLRLAGRLRGPGTAAALGRASPAAPRFLRRRVGRHCVPQNSHPRERAPDGADRDSSPHSVLAARPDAPRAKMASEHANSRPMAAPSLYFAARSFGASAAAGSGSAGRPVAPAEKRAISQERNKATASLLRSSGWVVR